MSTFFFSLSLSPADRFASPTILCYLKADIIRKFCPKNRGAAAIIFLRKKKVREEKGKKKRRRACDTPFIIFLFPFSPPPQPTSFLHSFYTRTGAHSQGTRISFVHTPQCQPEATWGGSSVFVEHNLLGLHARGERQTQHNNSNNNNNNNNKAVPF